MANKKTNFMKNVVITNLPALAALVLMAVALRITLHFNVFLSFIVLLVVYFFLGVTVELILDKLHARKKKNDLFKKYADGEANGSKPESGSFSLEELLRSTENEPSTPPASEPEPVEEKPLMPSEIFEDNTDSVPEEVSVPEEMPEPETPPAEPEPIPVVPVESVSEEEQDLLDSLTTGGFDLEPEEEPAAEEREAVSAPEEIPQEEPVSPAEEAAEEPETAAEAEPEETPAEESAEETEAEPSEEVPEVPAEEAPESSEEDSFFNVRISDLREEEEKKSEDIDVLFRDLFASDIKESESSGSVSAEDAEPAENEENSEADAEQPPAEEIPFRADAVKEALREVNADMQTLRARAEQEKTEESAPKSIFENDGFDVDFAPGEQPASKKSILFESVPDTEDDLDFIPYTDTPDSPAPAQKGKVRVDPKKIDELYMLMKDRKENGSIFGRKKKKKKE